MAIAIGVGVVALMLMFRNSEPEVARTQPAATVAHSEAESAQVIALVGPVALTDKALRRYQIVKRLSIGVTGGRQALEALCDRTLLTLAAAQAGITVSDAERDEQLFRRELIIAAVAQLDAPSVMADAAARPTWRRATTMGPTADLVRADMFARRREPVVSPIDRCAAVLLQSGISEEELRQEVSADVLATRARQLLTTDKVLSELRQKYPVRLLNGNVDYDGFNHSRTVELNPR
jgi:hypothetical protein